MTNTRVDIGLSVAFPEGKGLPRTLGVSIFCFRLAKRCVLFCVAVDKKLDSKITWLEKFVIIP